MAHDFVHLTTGDLAQLKALLRVFGEAFDEVDTYQGAVPSDEYLSNLLANPTFIAVVAREGDDVVGGLAAYQLDKFERDRREIYIYDLAVKETHRRRGIATGLIRRLQAVGKERRAYVIYVQADHVDAPAIALYESLGAREDVLHFDIPVEE